MPQTTNGWITLHRKIKDHWIFLDPDKLKAWITILLEVNHSERKVPVGTQLVTVKRGESVKELKTWSKLFGNNWSIGRVRGFFKMLEDDSMITRKSIRRSTHLRVCNYETYQSGELSNQSQINLKSISNQSQIATNNNGNNDNNDNKKKKPSVPIENIHIKIQGLILTKDEYAKLLEKYSEYEIADVLDAMENYKGLAKKYVSAYKTALNWLKRRSEDSNETFDWSKLK